jgi:predicted small lipoprotein YifL
LINKGSLRQVKWRFLYGAMILGVVSLALMSCGKKGPPFLPKTDMPLKVEPLKGQWTNEAVLLQGNIPALKGQKKDKPGVTGCRVYHAWYSLKNPPCEGCPIDYPGFQEIRGEILAGEEFMCEVFVEKKEGIHFFEVRLIGPKGEVGPPSNRVKLTSEN